MLSLVSSSSSSNSFSGSSKSPALINEKLPSDIFQKIFYPFFERGEHTPLLVCKRWQEEYLTLLWTQMNRLKGMASTIYPPLFEEIERLQAENHSVFFRRWKEIHHSLSLSIRKIPLSILKVFVKKSNTFLYGFREVESFLQKMEMTEFSLTLNYSDLIKQSIDQHQWLWALELLNDFIFCQDERERFLNLLCEKLVTCGDLEGVQHLINALPSSRKERILYLLADSFLQQDSFEKMETIIPEIPSFKDTLYQQIAKKYMEKKKWKEAGQIITEKIEDTYFQTITFECLFIEMFHNGAVQKEFFEPFLAYKIKDVDVLKKNSLHQNFRDFFDHFYKDFEIRLVERAHTLEQLLSLENFFNVEDNILSATYIVFIIKYLQLNQIDRPLQLIQQMMQEPGFSHFLKNSFEIRSYFCEAIRWTAKYHLTFAEKIWDHLYFFEYTTSLSFIFVKEAFYQQKQAIVWKKIEKNWREIDPSYYIVAYFAEKWKGDPEDDFTIQEVEKISLKLSKEGFYSLAYHLTDAFAPMETKHLFFFDLVKEYLLSGRLGQEEFFLEQIVFKPNQQKLLAVFADYFIQTCQLEKALKISASIENPTQRNQTYVKLFNFFLKKKELKISEKLLENIIEPKDQKKCSQNLLLALVITDLEKAHHFLGHLKNAEVKEYALLKTLNSLRLSCFDSLADQFFTCFQEDFDLERTEVKLFLLQKALRKKNLDEAYRMFQTFNFVQMPFYRDRFISLLIRNEQTPKAITLMGVFSDLKPEFLLELSFLLEGSKQQEVLRVLHTKSNRYQPLFDHKAILKQCMEYFLLSKS